MSDSLVDLYMQDVRDQGEPLSREEEVAVANAARAGDKAARERLIKANLRFVVKVAHAFKGYGHSLADLVSEGNTGLLEAVDKFDASKGNRFSTFAVWQIRARLLKFVQDNAFPVKVLTTQARRRVFFRLSAVRRKLGENADAEKIADALNDGRRTDYVTADDIAAMTPILAGCSVAIDSMNSETCASVCGPSMFDSRQPADEVIADEQEANEMRDRIALALGALNEKQRFIVRRRHMSENPMTLNELAAEMDLSRERVRQIERQAMNKLRSIVSLLREEA